MKQDKEYVRINKATYRKLLRDQQRVLKLKDLAEKKEYGKMGRILKLVQIIQK